MAPPNQVTKDFSLARISMVVGADAIVKRLKGRTPLELVRAPDQFDANSVMVVVPTGHGKRPIGYLPPGLAKSIAPLMDEGVKVIAQKAPNTMYGVCQIAYIPPAAEAEKPVEPAAAGPTELPDGRYTETIELPEGVTQKDLDEATPLPPIGDSRRPAVALDREQPLDNITEEVPHDEPSPGSPGPSE